MKPYVLFLLMAVAGTLMYHVGQKTLQASASPMVLLMAVYGWAFLMAAAAAPFFRVTDGPALSVLVFSRPVLLLALGVFLVEVGFLIAYRYGAPLQWSAAAVNGLSAALLVPLAVVAFGETLSATRLAGILCVTAGLFLFVRE
jgi:drug/metabolite transporter (DMT)-like permease